MTQETTPVPQPLDSEPLNKLTAQFEKLSNLYSLSDELTTSGNLQQVITYTVAEAQRLASTPELLERNEIGLMMMSLADQMLRVDNEIAGIEQALPHVYEAFPQTNTGKRDAYEKGVKAIHNKKEALHDEKERLRMLMMYCQFDRVRKRPDGTYTNIGRACINKSEVADLKAVASIDTLFNTETDKQDDEVKQAIGEKPHEVTIAPIQSTEIAEAEAEAQPTDLYEDYFVWGSGTPLDHVRNTLTITRETEQKFERIVLPNPHNKGDAWTKIEVVDGSVERSLVIREGAEIQHQIEHEYIHTQTDLGFAFGYGGIFMEGFNEAVTENVTSNPRAYPLQREVLQQIQNELTAGNPDLVVAAFKGDQDARNELYRIIVQTYGLQGFNLLARMVGGSNEVLFHTDIHLLAPCSEVMDVLREEKERVSKSKDTKNGAFTDLREWLKKLGR